MSAWITQIYTIFASLRFDWPHQAGEGGLGWGKRGTNRGKARLQKIETENTTKINALTNVNECASV